MDSYEVGTVLPGNSIEYLRNELCYIMYYHQCDIYLSCISPNDPSNLLKFHALSLGFQVYGFLVAIRVIDVPIVNIIPPPKLCIFSMSHLLSPMFSF